MEGGSSKREVEKGTLAERHRRGGRGVGEKGEEKGAEKNFHMTTWGQEGGRG